VGRPPKDAYLSPRLAALYLTERGYPISGQTIRRLCAKGRIEHLTTPGGYVRIRVAILDAFLASVLDIRSAE